MPLHACLSYADCRHRIRSANRYGPRSAVIWPFLKPALPDARPLAMVITSEAFEESSLWGILDLCRVASPPLRVLQTLPLPTVVDPGILLDLLHKELPSLPPIHHVYLDSELLGDSLRVVHNGMLITPASPQHTAFNSLVPALDLNVDLLERRPGYRAWYNTFEPRDLRGRPSTGASIGSSSSSFSADHTDSSASFHSDWVDQDELPFEPFPLLDPMSALSSTSTTTTGTSDDVYFPVIGVDPARCLHYALQRIPMAFRPCLRFNPRAYAWRLDNHALFCTIRGDCHRFALVWVIDRLSEARPRVLEVTSDLDFHALLAAAGLPSRRDVATVNGNAWGGEPRHWQDGDVVCVSTVSAIRGELRWKYHLRSMSPDVLRNSVRHFPLLVFPLLGPLISPGVSLSPAEQHAHVSLHGLLNHFRGALADLRAVLFQSGPRAVIFAGPGIPAFRVGFPDEPAPTLLSAAAFYRRVLQPFFGRRDIYRTGIHVADACVFAALVPGADDCTWLVPQGCGFDSLPGHSDGSDIGTRPVLDGMMLVPRVFMGRLGICWSKILAGGECLKQCLHPQRSLSFLV